MSDRPGPYKTLLRGTLVQLSGFSIGGNRPHGGSDNPVARDGRGRLVIRGSGLAGALIATARRLAGDDTLPWVISLGPPGKQQRYKEAKELTGSDELEMRLPESAWRFHHAHLESDSPAVALELRSGVAIRQDTGAAADHFKFDTEVVPAGTRWSFLLEIDDFRSVGDDGPEQSRQAPCDQVRSLALHALDQWTRGACFLGRDVARGLGWMRLEGLEAKVLRADRVTEWPDARLEPLAAYDRLKVPAIKNFDPLKAKRQRPPPLRTLSGRITIDVGSHIEDPAGEEAWGLDTLSPGGSEDLRPMQERQVTAAGLGLPALDGFAPDLTLAWTRPAGDPDAVPRPYLPGSGLRGPLRHALSWLLRRAGAEIADPSATQGARGVTDPVAGLFGTVDQSAALLLSDAELERPEDCRLLFLEQHAEDEFTGGTWAAAKFNRLALQSGRFQAHYQLQADDPEQLAEYRGHLRRLAALGWARQLPLGGAQWRGHGWVRWTWTDLDDDATETPA